MKKFELRKKEIIERIKSLEKKRDNYYSQTSCLENDIDKLNEQLTEKHEQLSEGNKKAEVIDSYVGFLEKQLVVEALEQKNYSIENFDLFEQDRLLFVLRNEDEKLFDWYVVKKQQGFTFGELEPLHKILKEDYEDFCKQYKE